MEKFPQFLRFGHSRFRSRHFSLFAFPASPPLMAVGRKIKVASECRDRCFYTIVSTNSSIQLPSTEKIM